MKLSFEAIDIAAARAMIEPHHRDIFAEGARWARAQYDLAEAEAALAQQAQPLCPTCGSWVHVLTCHDPFHVGTHEQAQPEPRCGNSEPHRAHDYYLKCPNMCADTCPGAGPQPTCERCGAATDDGFCCVCGERVAESQDNK